MEDKKFSVIIPIYNGAETIEKLFGSIIMQEQYIHEVIICNDRSTDNTLDVVEKYKNILPLKIITTPDFLDRGAGNARQCGLDIATGDWVVFADADDVFSYSCFYIYDQIILHNPDVKLIATAFDEIDKFFNKGMHYVGAMAWVHGKCFNIKYIKNHNISFPKNVYTHEDKYFVYRMWNCLRAEKLDGIALDQTTYYWTAREDSITHSSDYVLHSFIDSANAVIEPWEICKKEYKLSYLKMQEIFGTEPINCVFEMYAKIQCFWHVYGKEITLIEGYEPFIKLYSRIKDIFKFNGNDFIEYARKHPEELQSRRYDSLRTMGDYVEQQTFAQFIEEAEQKLRIAS